MGKKWKQWHTLFFGAPKSLAADCSHEIKRLLLLGRKAMTNLDSILKSRHITSLTKVYIVRVIVFPVVVDGCESWTIRNKNRCFWTVLLEKTLESSLDCKEIQPVHPKWWSWNSSTLATSCRELTHWKRLWCCAGKDWMWEEKGTTDDEMIGCYHWPSGHEFG